MTHFNLIGGPLRLLIVGFSTRKLSQTLVHIPTHTICPSRAFFFSLSFKIWHPHYSGCLSTTAATHHVPRKTLLAFTLKVNLNKMMPESPQSMTVVIFLSFTKQDFNESFESLAFKLEHKHMLLHEYKQSRTSDLHKNLLQMKTPQPWEHLFAVIQRYDSMITCIASFHYILSFNLICIF